MAPKTAKIIAQVLAIAYDIFGTMLLSVLAGLFLDKLFHLKGLFVIVLSLWGIKRTFSLLIHLGDEDDGKPL